MLFIDIKNTFLLFLQTYCNIIIIIVLYYYCMAELKLK